ncbi:MAG: sterol desaturase family protein [Robiginitomaculum sp.]|nr:sterol desaturase family protein [Robiginitomaculum sp.]
MIHHSSQHYNLTTALRQTWSGLLSGAFIVYVPIALMGFHPALMGFCFGLNLIYQFWFHTEVIDKMPRWFEAIMNTPSHHRVHHANNPRYLDANYAGVFIIWDKMFGTFVAEREDDKPRYGLVSDIGTFNPLRVATHEYVGIIKDVAQKGLTLKERLWYIFAEPGWCHDGGAQILPPDQGRLCRSPPGTQRRTGALRRKTYPFSLGEKVRMRGLCGLICLRHNQVSLYHLTVR